ncbi:MAG: damage-inducible protein DinB [Hyphomicrobiales bacterium]|nr:damage-inducible protein DinB [Hyphomicrobiales bacterium]
MIDPGFARTMARYNRWQNESLYGAAGALSDDERRRDRGAFFKSIHATLCHIYWADNMWMSRFSDVAKPEVSIPGSTTFVEKWDDLTEKRAAFDARIVAWADGLDAAALSGDLRWFSRAAQRDVVQPRWVAVAHFFNHQTHHRGQVHAMLTAAGSKPADTDFVMMQPA